MTRRRFMRAIRDGVMACGLGPLVGAASLTPKPPARIPVSYPFILSVWGKPPTSNTFNSNTFVTMETWGFETFSYDSNTFGPNGRWD